MRHLTTLCINLFCLSFLSAGTVAIADEVKPQPMPTHLGFPTPGYVVLQWIQNNNLEAMRQHSWDIWNTMAQPSGQYYGVKKTELPVWDTWKSTAEIWNTQGKSQSRQLHAFQLARQQLGLHGQHSQTSNDRSSGDFAVALMKFDPVAATFIETPQPAADGKMYSIKTFAGLEKINAAWPEDTPIEQRAIRDFTRGSVETKPTFFPVKKGKLTPVPMWQGGLSATNHVNPTPATWKNCVLVDSNNAKTDIQLLRKATTNEIANAITVANFSCKHFFYAPIGLFYSVTLTTDNAQAFDTLQWTTVDKNLRLSAGDHAVLVAMHVNTKETDGWTWQTYYWQGGIEQDVYNPGSLRNQPADLPAPWKHYAMCTAYDEIIGGQPVVCFNPYLETHSGIPDGIHSNCVTCHRVAAIGPNKTTPAYPVSYNPVVYPIPVQMNNPELFKNRTKTDHSWAVVGIDPAKPVKAPKTE